MTKKSHLFFAKIHNYDYNVFMFLYTKNKMKKILLLSLFTIFSIIPLWTSVLAQEKSKDTPQTPQTSSDIGIKFWNNCLKWMWRDCFDYEKMVWIEDSQPDYTATSIAQDLIFAATYILWTVLTIIMIICGLWYIFAARSWSSNTSKYKTWLINAAIWAILVRWAYAIVRLVQYIAAW